MSGFKPNAAEKPSNETVRTLLPTAEFSQVRLASYLELCNKIANKKVPGKRSGKEVRRMGKRFVVWSMGAVLALTVTLAGCKKKEEPPPPPPPPAPAPAAPEAAAPAPAPGGGEPAPAAPMEEKKMEEKKG